MEQLRIFICYRRDDGEPVADWLFRQLNGRVVGADGQKYPIELFKDNRHEATTDWQRTTDAWLRAAHTCIIVCTRGLVGRYDEQDGVDWVHRELAYLVDLDREPILLEAQDVARERIVPRRLAVRGVLRTNDPSRCGGL